MFGKIIVNKKEYEDLQNAIRTKSTLEDTYHRLYVDVLNQNTELKTLLSKEEDTQVIKYNGKLYRIASTTYYKDEAGESLDITAAPIGEVD